ncbi:GDSL-type esterase/lipase family protein [Lacrimispora sp. NSJ-141]|uniref:GDSL-type esterase/lipase family protein n=1 Tax=Lientehia hominis TaxID=2897778 RepID=A0AAP2W8Z2_9FIRM|nr:GDSL-type esterase/lipase family protein [Lientehia hominis]MCD2491262.1 GDSL-type esterase/lipase family protein [Lientehia hominis]
MAEAEKRLVFTGDSITDCDRLFDDRPGELGFGYVRMIYEQLSCHEEICVYNRGHNGFTAIQMLGRWKEDCISLKPDVLTVLVGINDLYMHIGGAGGCGAEGFGAHLEKLLLETREHTDAEIILMEPFVFPKPMEYLTWKEPLGRFRSQVRRLSQVYDTGFVPLWDVFSEAQKHYGAEALTTDGIHLKEKGHAVLAAAWLMAYKDGEDEP